MAKKMSCSRCHELLKPEEHGNRIQGFCLCDKCYPGIPRHIGRAKVEEYQYRERMKRAMPGFEKEIDSIWGGKEGRV